MKSRGLGLSLLTLSLVVATATSLDADQTDYLQPYKFVKPLDGLMDLYGRAEAEEERANSNPDSGARSEKSAAMSSDLSPPPEHLPVAEPQKLYVRSRKRAKLDSSKVGEERKDEPEPAAAEVTKTIELEGDSPATEEDETAANKTNILNHQLPVDKFEERSLPLPEPQALRVRIPPRPEDEYYYYYDDYYDEYYEDFAVRPSPPSNQKKNSARPVPTKKEPVSPTKLKKGSKAADLPLLRHPNHAMASHIPRTSSRKPESSSVGKLKSRGKKEGGVEGKKKTQYGISTTLKRLNKIKQSVPAKSSKPALPNPWDKINMPPKSSTRVSKPKPKPKPVKPVFDYYYDDYYYDYHPHVPTIKRQGPAAASSSSNPLALLVAPLAGIALLTAAAAVAVSPVLFSVSLTGKRRRRDAGDDEGISPQLEEKIHEMQVLEKFMSSIPENINYQHQVLSMYLSCSGYEEVGNHCLDRVVCEYANNDSHISEEERDVISIVLFNIMSNEFVSEEYKERLKQAARQGRDEKTCSAYECAALTELKTNDLTDS